MSRTQTSLPGSFSADALQHRIPRDDPYDQIEFHVQLIGFNSSGTHSFDVEGKFTWRFEATKHSLVIENGQPPATLESTYNEEIPSDELNKAMDGFVSYFVDEIRKRANGKPQG